MAVLQAEQAVLHEKSQVDDLTSDQMAVTVEGDSNVPTNSCSQPDGTTVRQARVSDEERLELMALYPSAREKKPDRLTEGFVDDGEPRFFLFLKNDWVEGFMAPFGDTIDFSLPNTCVSSAEFVGLRKLSARRASDYDSSNQDSFSPQSSVKSMFFGMLRTGQKGLDGQDQLPGRKVVNQWTSEDKQKKLNSRRNNLYSDGHTVRSRSETWPRSWVAEDGKVIQMFELLWKEIRSGGTIRRLKFETNQAGYDMVSAKIKFWAATSVENGENKDSQVSELSYSLGEDGVSVRNAGWPAWKGMRSLSAREKSNTRVGDGDKARLDDDLKGKRGVLAKDVHEPMGTLADGRARIQAAKQAVEITGSTVMDSQRPLPENIISFGSVMIEGKVLPKRDGTSQILQDHHFKALAAALPARLRASSWALMYSTSRDGISLNTLYRKVNKRGPLILIAKDMKQHIFGCFSSEEWKVAARYYGNGECFVFQVKPELRAYRWTRANSYFMYSTTNVLAMGGGTNYGLLINADLITGCSGECETFGNGTLAGSKEFELLHVEVWGFR